MSDEARNAARRSELQRGERFLAAYNVIERALRRKIGDPGGRESFRRLVDILSSRDFAVRKFREDLVEFAELRNAIVHDRMSPEFLIAVPLEETVDKIEKIASAIEEPPLVYPRFGRKVVCFGPEDEMESVFRTMASTGYTQFPVYDGGTYVGLLTDGGVARWLASTMAAGEAGGGPLDKLKRVKVLEVLKSEKNPDRAKFVSRRATVYEAEHLFAVSGNGSKWRTAVLLITENGDPGEALLGMITPSDILAYLRE